jgi:predicted acetyltransferase
MDRCLADQVAAGRPIAALWASESVIYGRYGFGSAAPALGVEVDTGKPLRLRIEPDARSLRLIDLEGAEEVLNPLYERSRRRRAGQLVRDPEWWRRNHLLEADPDHKERTAPHIVLHDEGYAIFRTSHQHGRGRVHLQELIADTPPAEAALWTFLASIDLTETIEGSRPLDDTLRAISADLDQIKVTELAPALWLRLTDVPAALAARSWAAKPDLVLDVQDDRLTANHGRWRLTGEKTDAAADLTLQVRDLAAAYLSGGTPITTLVRTGLATEHTDGAAASLDAALATPYGPHLTDDF